MNYLVLAHLIPIALVSERENQDGLSVGYFLVSCKGDAR